ncbi:MAG: M48 family metalloprotease [Rhizobiales bacterium]|nr:M48 family metalloprotease [Hyphomicrobiales bacterium]
MPETVTPSQREHQRILASYGGAYHNPRLEALISQTVEKLASASEHPELRYRVTILNSPAVNAFALPSGQLYVTRGMLALASDTSELASVLAHEMAHVLARHAATREDKAKQAAIVSRVVSDVLNDPQMGALALAKSKLALATFSRGQELEADGIGVELASRAGFDPYGASRFLTAMGRNASLKPSNAAADPRLVDFLSSHPSTPERVKNAVARARQLSAPSGPARERGAYLAALSGVPYGEDPSDGMVRGRRFLHPRLGFSFVAPAGFSLDNTAQAVLGIKDDGEQALRMDVVRVPAEQTLTSYLTSGWIEGVDPASATDITVNGFAGATALAKGDQWSFRLYVVRFGAEVYRFVFATKNRTAAADRAFRASIDSFRRTSDTENANARPLRIQLATVKGGDTPETFAARMSTEQPLDRFLLLNGLQPGQTLTPGAEVKIVTE